MSAKTLTDRSSQSSRRGDSAQTCDVIIAGGGFIGLSLAIALGEAGFQVALIERSKLDDLTAAPYDGRASAFALATQRMLDQLGIWQGLEANAQPIHDIRISDGRVDARPSSLFLHFAANEAGEAKKKNADAAMGYIVLNRDVRRAMQERAKQTNNLDIFSPDEIGSWNQDNGLAQVHLASGKVLRAPLLVAADGRNSMLRKGAGLDILSWTYPQKGLVLTVMHDLPHCGVAHEHFLPSGPLALLPLRDDAQGRHRSSVVWTEKSALADHLMTLDNEHFANELQRRFGDSLGKVSIEGQRWCYPLGAHMAHRFYDKRLALVGDSAHGIHPIAGQGLNLGLRDVAALAECLVDAARRGEDLGSRDVLARYQRWRMVDTAVMVAATDGLNRLFSNDFGPLRLARDLGLAGVDKLPFARRFFMRHAMGVIGDLPKLLKGQSLLSN